MRANLTDGLGFLFAYQDMHSMGAEQTVRGTRTLEMTDARIEFAPYERLSSFDARKLNLDYCKAELEWYLRADRFDHSIQKHATMWKKLVAPDGGYNSNYGQYLFKEKTPDGVSQIDWVVKTLAEDEGSRQAVCTLLKPEHLYADNPDVVCTYSMSFRIRDGRLQMTVNMRSNDLIFGTTNDVFCFSVIHEMVHAMLKFKYRDLELGTYVHRVDSLHVYERHFDMLDALVEEGMGGHRDIEVPLISESEAVLLTRGAGAIFSRDYAFTNWLMTRDKS